MNRRKHSEVTSKFNNKTKIALLFKFFSFNFAFYHCMYEKLFLSIFIVRLSKRDISRLLGEDAE